MLFPTEQPSPYLQPAPARQLGEWYRNSIHSQFTRKTRESSRVLVGSAGACAVVTGRWIRSAADILLFTRSLSGGSVVRQPAPRQLLGSRKGHLHTPEQPVEGPPTDSGRRAPR